MTNPPNTPEYAAFKAVSARLGADPMLVQAAGGNTSMKIGATLWVKASGTWLADALTRDIMVPLDLDSMTRAMSNGDLKEADISGYVIGGTTARASVEAPFHAAFAAKYVLHVHCIPTIAHAVLDDAKTRLATKLDGLDWGFVPYMKPGLPLTYAMMESGVLNHDIVVLGNHGLIVAHDDLAHAEKLLQTVHDRLRTNSSPIASPKLTNVDPTPRYRPCTIPLCQRLATDPVWQQIVSTRAIAPDFLVFLGPTLPILSDGPDLHAALGKLAQHPLPIGSAVIVKDKGVLIRADAMNGTEQLLEGLSAVLSEIEAAGWPKMRYFTEQEEHELMNWDAEKYRQSLNAGGGNA